MSERKIIPGGPLYSAAQCLNGVVYTSGQLGLVPGTLTLVDGGVKEQTRAALNNLASVLEKSGSSLAKVMKTTCFLNDIADYAAFNEVYLEFFPDEATRPARTCFGPGGLPKGGLVEVEAIAVQE